MNIADIIRQIVLGGNLELYFKICIVDEIDEEARTIECTPIDESAPFTGVNLQADQNGEDGVVLFPAKDSYVVVGFLNPSVACVVLTTKITKVILTTEKVAIEVTDQTAEIKINDGSVLKLEDGKVTFNDGSETMINGNELKTQLQTMSGRIDAIINAISSAPIAPMDGGATFKGALVASLAPHLANKENFTQIVDDNIKH